MNETSQETISVSNESLSSLFHRAARFMARAHHHQGHAHHAQGRILSILKEEGALNQRDLLEILDIRSSSLSELLGKLERRNLIARERDEQDKRNYIITVTEQGATIVTDREQGIKDSALFASLNEEERQQLSALLRKLITAWEAEYSVCDSGRDRHEHRHGHGHGHEHGPERGRMHGRRREPHDHGPHGHGPREYGLGPREYGLGPRENKDAKNKK